MKRTELIIKWLDNELDAHELELFKGLEDYEQLIRLSDTVQEFKAPEYNTSEELETVLQAIVPLKAEKTKSRLWKQVLRVAAVLVLGLGIFYYTTTLDTTLHTGLAELTTLSLPDASEVTLNAQSELRFNKSQWNTKRTINLTGEAYFKVAKGRTFEVLTSEGSVTVLGTEFKVKKRDNLFEVICYEGSVKVTHQDRSAVLLPGDSFLIIDGNYIAREKENHMSPSWLNNESYFKSMPFKYVLREFERQYNLRIDAQNVALDQLFTGSFPHENLEMALKSITLPLNLNYNIDHKTIVLSRE